MQKYGYVLYLAHDSITTSVCCYREQSLQLISLQIKLGVQILYHLLYMKNLHKGWINIGPELTAEVSILGFNPNS